MFSHGIMTALFFAVVGMVYDRAHTRNIGELGGLFRKMPVAAVGFIIAGLVSMGMPGFSGFVAEFPIFMGAWKALPIVAIIAILGVIVTAGYILLVIRGCSSARSLKSWRKWWAISALMDKIVVGVLAALMIFIGWFPTFSKMVPMIESGVGQILGPGGRCIGGSHWYFNLPWSWRSCRKLAWWFWPAWFWFWICWSTTARNRSWAGSPRPDCW